MFETSRGRRSKGTLMRTLGLTAAVACVAIAAAPAKTGAPTPRVVAVVKSASGPQLQLRDARTLQRVPRSWSLPVGTQVPAALSPSRSRVAVAVGPIDTGNETVLVLDTATGRVIERIRDAGDTSNGLYWFGGESLKGRNPAVLVAVGYDCSPDGCGDEFTVAGSQGAVDIVGAEPVAAAKEGLVIQGACDDSLEILGNEDRELPRLSKLPTTAACRVVADVAHDRLYQVSSAGLVAEIDHVGRSPSITYHRVDLNGRPFEAAWAGAGRIALWGKDGLGTIDTRSWKTHAIAANVEKALATPFGIAAWSTNPGNGLSLYRPDGARRFQVLVGTSLTSAQTVGQFLYVDTPDTGRFSVDLRTGEVVGPLRSSSQIIAPTLVTMP